VHDALLVCHGQRGEDPDPDLGDALFRQWAVLADELGEGESFDQLHHDQRATVVDHHVVHGDDAGMPQARGGPRLPQHLAGLEVPVDADPDMQLLDGDVPPQELVIRPPHHAHPTLAQAAEQPVPTGDHSHGRKPTRDHAAKGTGT
jgi:hypothetical protein